MHAAHASLFNPSSLLVDESLWATSLLGVVARLKNLWAFFFFPSCLCCPPRFENSPQTHQWEDFLVFGNFSSFTTPYPGWVYIPNSSVTLFTFYISPYLLLKRMGWLPGCLMSSTSIQKLFCGTFSVFKWSFDEFVGEKVVSLSYSSAISIDELFKVIFLYIYFKVTSMGILRKNKT